MSKQKQSYYDVTMVSSIAEMIDNALTECPDKIAYRYKMGDGIFSITYSSFIKRITNLGAFLTEKGFGNKHIACVGANSINWINAYLTVLRSAGVFVPIDKDLPGNDIINLIINSDCEVVFFDKKHEKFFRENEDKLANIKLFIGFDLTDDSEKFISFDSALRSGSLIDKSKYLSLKSAPKELKLLVYTSGTTGMAKGVMLSEHNLVSCICNGLMISTVYETGLSILPYNHTYESVADILISFHHHSTLCISESLVALMKNLKLFKPDYLYIVPAIAEMIYTRLNRELEASGAKEKFELLINHSNGMRKIGIDKRRDLFGTVLDTFGGNLIKIVCGGAPIRAEVAEFFDNIGISLVNGYGITECSPLVSVNTDDNNDYKTAGALLPCLTVKIDNPNSEGIGEILVKGDNVMLGYYKEPKLTKEVIKNGWFYTGDYGYLNEDEHLVICGRKKNVIVLNNGKNIYPEELEGYIQGIDYVSEVIVSSEKDENGNENSLNAEVFLSEVKTPAEVLKAIKAACKELPIYKQISNVIIRDKEFEKTSSNKIKRIKKEKEPKAPKEPKTPKSPKPAKADKPAAKQPKQSKTKSKDNK